MMKDFIGFMIFLFVAGLVNGIAWLGGLNYDHRGGDIAFAVTLSLFMGAVAFVGYCAIMADLPEKEKPKKDDKQPFDDGLGSGG